MVSVREMIRLPPFNQTSEVSPIFGASDVWSHANWSKCGGAYSLRLRMGSGNWVSHKVRKRFIPLANSKIKNGSFSAPISFGQPGGVVFGEAPIIPLTRPVSLLLSSGVRKQLIVFSVDSFQIKVDTYAVVNYVMPSDAILNRLNDFLNFFRG